ncbi:hypothetical protein GCM10027605_27680 [Micromonospora zhanjiangensis]
MRTRTPLTRLAAGTAVVALALTGCSVTTEAGGEDVSVGKGSIQKDEALAGQSIAIGSKEFTENIVLGHIAMLALKAAGANVVDKTNIKGSVNVRKAMLAGEVNAYWEYTGTGWITYLGHTDPIADSQRQYEAVAKEDKEKNGVVWGPSRRPTTRTRWRCARTRPRSGTSRPCPTWPPSSRRTRTRRRSASRPSSAPATTAGTAWPRRTG